MASARKRGVANERTMGLYRAAFSTGMVSKAALWRFVLVEFLAERDGTGCGICGVEIDLTLKSGPRGDDMGPSIDHIVPWSESKDDSLPNLRLSHWICNRNRGIGEGESAQLRTVA